MQADTVAHCGNSLSGQFIWTLTVTDEYSGWTENRASLGKDACGILTAISQATWQYPMNIKSFNTDSGTEFINQKLQEYMDSRGINFTRSRPYRKMIIAMWSRRISLMSESNSVMRDMIKKN